MPVKLSRASWAERAIPLGYGVSVTFRRFGYAEYKAAEALAHKRARASVETANLGLLELGDDEVLSDEAEADLIGKAAEILIDTLVLMHASGWEGVEDADASTEGNIVACPLTAQTWAQFRSHCPVLVDVLQQRLVLLHQMIDAEGKGFAPSPDTAIPAG
ncbi:MAG: hypothetical protein GY717_15485 [Rhodobacteraceae bacterium]|nr:hypothetical protein [Paracoccaceae bacterium]